MTRVIIDLAAKRQGASSSGPLEHPAGVTLPFDSPSDAALIIPEIRSEIRSGTYSADLLRQLPGAIDPGDRVLVIGAGLGVVSSLIAKNAGVDRVIAIEANTTLIPYLMRVHELNGVPEIETLNAVLADGKTGRVPFFARRDLRTSSLVPHDRSWQQVMMVPFMNLNLILTEEQISLVVCDIPVASAGLLAQAELGSVDRILLDCGEDFDLAWEEGGVCKLLEERGYTAEVGGTAVLFHRAGVGGRAARTEDAAATMSANGAPLTGGEGAQQPLADDDDLDDEFEHELDGGFGDGFEFDVDEQENAGEAPADVPEPFEPAAPQAEGPSSGGSGAVAPGRSQAAEADGAAPKHAPLPDSGGSGRAGRLWWLVALSLFMALPLILIGEIADNRAERQAMVTRDVAAIWGGPQTLTGPYIVVPVVSGASNKHQAPLVLLPDMLKIDSQLSTELRGHGVFEVPVYRGRHAFRLDLDPALAAGVREAGLLARNETALWGQAALGLGIAEPRALRGRPTLTSGAADGGEQTNFAAGGFDPGVGVEQMDGIHAPIGDPRRNTGGWAFTLELDGSQQLRLTPAGGVTEGRLSSDWSDPRFAGAFLPARRVTGETGFEAQWTIPQLAHSMPQAFRGTVQLGALEAASFGVDLVPPADIYQTASRAAKIGLLLIAMTFGAIFLMEKLAGRRPHMVHYALVGAAQCVFFALLVSLAEQVGFNRAYGLAVMATIPLLTAFAWYALRLGPRSGWLAAALTLLYGVAYLILSTEEQALLMGAVLAFIAIAAVMWGTRNEDWSATLGSMTPEPKDPKG